MTKRDHNPARSGPSSRSNSAKKPRSKAAQARKARPSQGQQAKANTKKPRTKPHQTRQGETSQGTKSQGSEGKNLYTGKTPGRGRQGQPRRDSRTQRGTTPVRPGRATGGAGRQKGLGGDQVEGRQAVKELLLAQRRRTREVLFAADLDPAPILDEIVDLADEAKVAIRSISRSKFDAGTRTDSSQGVMALAQPLPNIDLEDLPKPTGGTPPFLLVLDGVTDPNNLGAILRVAECAGVTGVVVPRHRAARITPSVTKSAAGAVEHLDIAQVAGVPSALQYLRDTDVWTVGLDMVADSTVFDLRVADEALALVLGAEGTGLSRLARERCDIVVRIPLTGNLNSLNVATAAAVACYEVVRRRS